MRDTEPLGQKKPATHGPMTHAVAATDEAGLHWPIGHLTAGGSVPPTQYELCGHGAHAPLNR